MRGRIPLRFPAAKREPAGPVSGVHRMRQIALLLPERPPCARSRTVQKHRASKRPVGELAVIIDNSGASWRNLASRDASSALYQSAGCEAAPVDDQRAGVSCWGPAWTAKSGPAQRDLMRAMARAATITETHMQR